MRLETEYRFTSRGDEELATEGHHEETCLRRDEVIFEEKRGSEEGFEALGRVNRATIGVMVSGWCPCVPLGRRQSPAQQQQQQQPPSSSSRAPFTVSGATDRADMVQMFYYENRGKCCKKLLRYNGYPNKVRQFTSLISRYRNFDPLNCTSLRPSEDSTLNLFDNKIRKSQ